MPYAFNGVKHAKDLIPGDCFEDPVWAYRSEHRMLKVAINHGIEISDEVPIGVGITACDPDGHWIASGLGLRGVTTYREVAALESASEADLDDFFSSMPEMSDEDAEAAAQAEITDDLDAFFADLESE